MSSPPNLNPLQYGWEINELELQPTFTPPVQLATPDEVFNLISCGCKTGCKTVQHSVLVLNLTLPVQRFANV